MPRKPILTVDQKIKRTQEAIEKAKTRYEDLLAELDQLRAERDNERKEEIFVALSRSQRSFDEILEFIRSGSRGRNVSKKRGPPPSEEVVLAVFIPGFLFRSGT